MPTVKDCLAGKPNVLYSVAPTDFVARALEKMHEHCVRAILVVQDNKLEGIITQQDGAIKVCLGGHDPQKVLVKDFMSTHLVMVSLEDSLETCMELMTINSIRHLPVIEKDQLIGVVSVGDMVKEILKHKVDTIKFLSRYIKEWDSSHTPIARL